LNAIKRAQRTPAPAGPGGGCCSRGSSAHGSYSRGIATCAGSPRREPIMEKGLHRPTIRAGRNRFRSITQKFLFLRISRVFWPVIGSTRVRSAARTRSSLTPCSRAALARSDLRLSGPRALPWRRSARRPRPSIFGRAVCRARRARSSAAGRIVPARSAESRTRSDLQPSSGSPITFCPTWSFVSSEDRPKDLLTLLGQVERAATDCPSSAGCYPSGTATAGGRKPMIGMRRAISSRCSVVGRRLGRA